MADDEESRTALKILRARFLAPLGMTAWRGFSAACEALPFQTCGERRRLGPEHSVGRIRNQESPFPNSAEPAWPASISGGDWLSLPRLLHPALHSYLSRRHRTHLPVGSREDARGAGDLSRLFPVHASRNPGVLSATFQIVRGPGLDSQCHVDRAGNKFGVLDCHCFKTPIERGVCLSAQPALSSFWVYHGA